MLNRRFAVLRYIRTEYTKNRALFGTTYKRLSLLFLDIVMGYRRVRFVLNDL